MNPTILAIFILGLASFSSSIPQSRKTTKSFSPLENLSELALSYLHQKEHNLTSNSLFDVWRMLRVESYFIDMRTLLTQSIKVDEESPLLELYHSEGPFELCLGINGCHYYVITLASKNTRITGQKQITSVNTVTPTFFKNSFHCPYFIWHSPDFLFNVSISDLYDALVGDVYISIDNLRIDTSFNYSYVPELGIQISNLRIEHNIGYIRSNIEKITSVYPDGSVRVYDPLKSDITEWIHEYWKMFKREYHEYLQLRINCFLSGLRLDPMICDEDEVGFIFNLSVLQLIQTIGLNSLDRH